jgi:threonyl-tRNA synthetase
MPRNEHAIEITLPDGSVRETAVGATPHELARGISRRLASAAVAARVDGELRDLTFPLAHDARLEILRPDDPDSLAILRHSTAHLTAQAVQELFPGTRIAQGPVIENGFYYDFDRAEPFSDEDLAAIEERMREIVARDLPVERLEMSRDEALELFRKEDEPYKAYFAETKGGDTVSVYRQGDWNDFCRGPHVPSTGRLGHFKLLSVAGAYWLGDESQKMLQRIYGTAFFTRKELDEHLRQLEEAKARDHRKLGRELGLFSFHPESPGSPFFHPRGAVVYNLLIDYVRELYLRYGYDEVLTPQIFDAGLWRRSGHYDHYREHMYFTEIDAREYAVKPMNCPAHCLMYAEGRPSYRDLPMRLADFGRLHRYELSGAVGGLTRVRSFAQDDAHIFCTPEQVRDEVLGVVRMVLECYALFGFPVEIVLSTRPEDRAGEDALWDRAEEALRSALTADGCNFRVAEGEGAFYGPKIDFIIRDALGREHQLGTVQLDYVLPERFDLRFIDAEDREQRPVMVHRAMLGSLERFLGILLEHCAGALPFWLVPEQVRVLSITERTAPYAERVRKAALERGLRVGVDVRNEKIGAKIRQAQMEKIPLMLVVGDREEAAGSVAVRLRTLGDRGAMELPALLDRAQGWAVSRSLESPWSDSETTKES